MLVVDDKQPRLKSDGTRKGVANPYALLLTHRLLSALVQLNIIRESVHNTKGLTLFV